MARLSRLLKVPPGGSLPRSRASGPTERALPVRPLSTLWLSRSISSCETPLLVTTKGAAQGGSEDSAHVGAIGLALEPLAW